MERDSDRGMVACELEAEVEDSGFVRALATIVIATAAVLMALLPALIALRFVALPVSRVGVALGCVGAAVGGVKLIAMAWAVGGRLSAAPRAHGAVATAD